MIICEKCKAENPEVNSKCFSCGAVLLVGTLECVSGEGNMQEGTKWQLLAKNYSLGRSKHCDICIPGTYVSRQHGNLIYNAEENRFYYESLATNTMDYEKGSYKIFDGAILPFPASIELKLNYS